MEAAVLAKLLDIKQQEEQFMPILEHLLSTQSEQSEDTTLETRQETQEDIDNIKRVLALLKDEKTATLIRLGIHEEVFGTNLG